MDRERFGSRFNTESPPFSRNHEKTEIEKNEKFLDLWKDADPGIAEVGNARERVAGLR
jgi:hypothetical protein